jgi:Xaa-Pro aminopeptidase
MSMEETLPVVGARLVKLRRLLREAKKDGLIITSPENRRYYSGFTATDPMLTESCGSLLILPDKQYLLTDSRYTLIAGLEAPGFEIVTASGGGGLGKCLKSLSGGHTSLAFESQFMTYALHSHLTKSYGLKLVPCPFDPSDLRAEKSPDEVKLITRALEITETTIGWLFERLAPGWTEGEAAWFLDSTFRELGAQGPAFETIVASGPQAALPHAVPGDKKIELGELVVIDCGALYQGYASDITRTFISGEPEKWQKSIYQTVRQAQLMAIEAMAPGVPCQAVDKIARDHIAKAGHFEHFGHGLGHGVGLAVHELPGLNPRNGKPLTEGMVVTVEPGIYLPGQGGVRLEQLVLITKNGCKVLNKDNHFYDF